MKKTPVLSIKTRITLWYAALLVSICAAALFVLAAVSERAADKYCRDALLSAASVIIDELDIDEGRVEIDSDIDEVPGVYASLFALDGSLLYGRDRAELPFEEGRITEVRIREDGWYVYDVLLTVPNREDVWLRLYMSSNVQESAARTVLASGAWLLPLLALLALAGGHVLTVKAFRPVKEMGALAASIAGGSDLSRRIPFGGGSADELHDLADTFNAMLGRLEAAFLRESRFASDAAHELRTPLNAIRTQGEYALSRESGEEKDEAIGRMLEKSGEMHALVDQLLLIARMDAGEMRMEETIELKVLIERIAEDMEPVALERGMDIAAKLVPCTVIGNRAMLSRAVINLMDNAIRYGKEGGCVRVTTNMEADAVVIAVEDDGDGMSGEEMAHAFERFWRADSARSSTGTGIGLSIVQSAAHAHGGEASVSRAPGGGCVFEIRLPL